MSGLTAKIFRHVKWTTFAGCAERHSSRGSCDVFFMEDDMVKVQQISQIDKPGLAIERYDVMTPLACVALSIVALSAIYFASISPGTAVGEFASMTVFP